MKRRRSNKARSDRSVSPAGCTMRRRIESPRVSEDDAEEEPQPRRSNDSSTLLPLQSQREPRGFAYLRDANKKTTTTSSLVVPQASSSEEESGDVAASPISTRSITRGFSHLRESISFALPRLYGSVPGVSMTRGGSVVVPLSTSPPPPPRDSAVRRSNSSSRSQRANRGTPFLLQNNNNNINNNNKSNNRYQNQNQQQHRRNLDYHNNRKSSGSDHSFLSSHSAIEYLNSTGSLGEVFSSRGSRRSSRATASHHSMSRSTLGPLDLSPILKKERQPRRRRRRNDTGGIEAAGGSNCNGGNNNDSSSVCQPPLNGLPIDVPAAVVNPPPTGVRNSQKMTLEEFHRSLARLSRVVSFLLFSFFLIAVWGVMAAPLVMRQSSPEEVFVRHYVDSISELQFIYEVPYASLSSSDARRLYLRVLSETLERLERSTSHVKPGANIEAQILHHKQMIRAYLTVRHRARLYARSRERSRLNQFVISPLHAAWQYGFERHGFMTTLRELVLEPSFSHVWARVKDIASCLRQDEKMLCPTLEYIQEEQQQQQQQHEGEEHEYGVPLDNNELNPPSLAHNGEKAVEELRQLKRMLNYVKESCRKRNRDYNHLLTGDDTESVLSMKKSPGLGGHGRAVTNITTPCNIVLLGSAGSGKTAIVQQFITRTLCQDYFPTTLETFMLISTVDNEKYRLHVCDCSGSKRFKDHRAPYIAEADGLMFVYSITEMHSLLYLLESAKEAYNVRRKQSVKVSLPILFVGTNADAPPEQRVVEMPNAEGVAADCLSTLGVKLSKRESRSVKKIKADTSKGAADGISFTYPVLEIASVNHREVVQAMQIMIRLVRSFRETSRLPPVCLMYKKIERLRLNPSDLMNVAAASPNASSEASVYYMTSEFGGGNRPEFYPTCNSSTVTSDPGEGVSYSPRSAYATPSVYSSIILGEEDDDRDRTSVLNEEEYLQGPTTTNSCNVVGSPVWTCGLEDRSRNVVSGDEVSRPETSSSGVTPQRNETKREPKHRQCPICNIM